MAPILKGRSHKQLHRVLRRISNAEIEAHSVGQMRIDIAENAIEGAGAKQGFRTEPGIRQRLSQKCRSNPPID
ncbi:hypothetical protein J2Y51_003918 [Bosea sp. BE109]|nr:hypothetical protein [Bosea sp. BE109]